jgi:hemerythrin-like domain-containing protein
MKATQLLKDEHGHILRALSVLEEMAARATRGETINKKDAEDMVHILEGFADRHHQGKEEAILFPALLQDRDQRYYNVLCCLIFEHNRERFLVQGLEESVRSGNTRDFVYCATSLVDKLRNHIEKEEEGLFSLADSVLSAQEDERVNSEMQQFERAWQQHVLTRLRSRLDELEAEYCPQRSTERKSPAA